MLQFVAVCCSVWQSVAGGDLSYYTHKPTHTSDTYTHGRSRVIRFSIFFCRLIIVYTLSKNKPLSCLCADCVCVCVRVCVRVRVHELCVYACRVRGSARVYLLECRGHSVGLLGRVVEVG